MSGAPIPQKGRWLMPAAVFGVVLALQLWLVAVAGTDIPFYDQWEIEGSQLYPAWLDGRLQPADLLRPANEHRILWSNLLNLGLFVLNGQWDPLVQLAVVAGVRAASATALAAMAGQGLSRGRRWGVAAGVAAAFLPHLAWHNVLWGIESFVLILSLAVLWLLGAGRPSPGRTAAGLVAGLAVLVAMGPGILAPAALLGWAAFRALESRKIDATAWRLAWPALLLFATGVALRVSVPGHTGLGAMTPAQFLAAFFRLVSWPHGLPVAAVLMNLPLLLVAAGRLARRRHPAPGEDFVLLAAGWSVVVALATALARGGGDEIAVGVPSRYVDFLVLLPLANVWCVVALLREAAPRWQASVRLTAAAWGIFLFAGWLALSAQVMRGIILPRARDREAPVRLVREFQLTRDPAVFAGQPRLLVPHPQPAVVLAVLEDPRLQGHLPPSLQPGRPLGPLSRAVRTLLGR